MKEVTLVFDTQVTIVLNGLTEEQAAGYEKLSRGQLQKLGTAMGYQLGADDANILRYKAFVRDMEVEYGELDG